MGDVIHALPALSDARRFIPDIEFDFVVEDSFKEIPSWHDGVSKVIPVATRRSRKNFFRSFKEIFQAYKELKREDYDVIIDAQGLIKSSIIAKIAKGDRHGFSFESIREPVAAKSYHFQQEVSKSMHAISRIRLLTAKSLAYEDKLDLDHSKVDYGLSINNISEVELSSLGLDQKYIDSKPYIVFLHGTTWVAKEWPIENWRELAKKFSSSLRILLPWGNEKEYKRAKTIAEQINNVDVLPKLSLTSMAHLINNAQCVVSVDTGLGHLAAALGKPTLSIYGPTNTQLIGTMGHNQHHMSASEHLDQKSIKKNKPFDYDKVSAEKVFQKINNDLQR